MDNEKKQRKTFTIKNGVRSIPGKSLVSMSTLHVVVVVILEFVVGEVLLGLPLPAFRLGLFLPLFRLATATRSDKSQGMFPLASGYRLVPERLGV